VVSARLRSRSIGAAQLSAKALGRPINDFATSACGTLAVSDYVKRVSYVDEDPAYMTDKPPSTNPWIATRTRTGQEYDAPYETRAALGVNVHGEADLVSALLQTVVPQPTVGLPYRVLDAGCGTGRIAIELARRGIEIIGVDLDEVMLTQAYAKAPYLDWRLGDLSTIDLEQCVDCVLLAGNVMIYLTPGTEAATLTNMARHLKQGGIVVAAFELPPPSWSIITLETYDRLARAAGLMPIERWSTWQQDRWSSGDRYAVSVHQK
jgi:SAM-dependent methyltransferase